jgi:hypothetical protein
VAGAATVRYQNQMRLPSLALLLALAPPVARTAATAPLAPGTVLERASASVRVGRRVWVVEAVPRATVVGPAPPGQAVHERRVPLDPGLFSLEPVGAGK